MWTRELIKSMVALSGYPNALADGIRKGQIKHDPAPLLKRLRGDLVELYFHAWGASIDVVRGVVDMHRSGASITEIVEVCGQKKDMEWTLPYGTIARWCDRCDQQDLLLLYLDGAKRDELKLAAERLFIAERTRYKLQAKFVAFASAELAREPLRSQCKESHGEAADRPALWDPGMRQRIPECESCRILWAFDRYGESRILPENFGSGREPGTRPFPDDTDRWEAEMKTTESQIRWGHGGRKKRKKL